MSLSGNFDVPADGPDAALVHIVRRERMRYSRTFINTAILEHRQPSSLLALVEVGKRLGLEATAARAEAAALEQVPLPAIVHFGAPGAEGGFAVLEEITDDGYRLWDSVNGSRLVSRDAFLAPWSGIVVVMERSDEGGEREPGYLRARLVEIVAGRTERPALVGARARWPLQAVAALLLATLALLSATSVPHPHRVAFIALIALAGGGLAVALLTVSATSERGAALAICKRGRLLDCEGVLTSRYSVIFGLPLSEIGTAFFGAVLLLIATGGLAREAGGVAGAIALAFLATIPFSLALVGVQVSMRQLCTLCLGIHTVNLAGALVAILMLRDLSPSLGPTIAALVFMGLMFVTLLFIVIPYVTSVNRIERRTAVMRKIEGSPFATLAQVLAARPIALQGKDCAVPLADPGGADSHELVVFVHPGCSRCWTVMQELDPLLQTGRVALHLAVAPKDDNPHDHRLCTAVVAAGLSGGGRAAVVAYQTAKAYLAGPLVDDPFEDVVSPLDEAKPGAEHVDQARALVEAAASFAETHLEGTPALFLDGRALSAPPAHLAFLLSRHPELLDPLLGDDGMTR